MNTEPQTELAQLKDRLSKYEQMWNDMHFTICKLEQDLHAAISQEQIENILSVPNQINFPMLQIWKSQTTWVVKLLTDDPPCSATGATLAEAIAKFK